MNKSWQAVLAVGLSFLLPQACFAANIYDCHPQEEFHWQDGSLQQSDVVIKDVLHFDIKSGEFRQFAGLGKDMPAPQQSKLQIIQEPKVGEDLIAQAAFPGNPARHMTLRIRRIIEAKSEKPTVVPYEPTDAQRGNVPKDMMPKIRVVTLPKVPFVAFIDDVIYTGQCDEQ